MCYYSSLQATGIIVEDIQNKDVKLEKKKKKVGEAQKSRIGPRRSPMDDDITITGSNLMRKLPQTDIQFTRYQIYIFFQSTVFI